jgi:hypothetical protein
MGTGTMSEGADDWQVVGRRTSNMMRGVMALLSRLLFQIPDATGVSASNVTWTVRNARTGEVRKITAASDQEFKERLAAQVFD